MPGDGEAKATSVFQPQADKVDSPTPLSGEDSCNNSPPVWSAPAASPYTWQEVPPGDSIDAPAGKSSETSFLSSGRETVVMSWFVGDGQRE